MSAAAEAGTRAAIRPHDAGSGDDLGAARSAESRRACLEARARAAAEAPEVARAAGERVVVFEVGGERYAVEADAVTLVLDVGSLGPLVGAPPWLIGAALARTRIVPVLDLRPLLGLQRGGMSDLTRILVVERDGDAFGLAVEVLEGEREIGAHEVTPATFGPFRWVAADRTALLDLDRLAAPGEG